MTYIDQEQADRGRAAADEDWPAGTVRTNQDVAMWNHSSYALAYIARIKELAAEHSWHPSRPEAGTEPQS